MDSDSCASRICCFIYFVGTEHLAISLALGYIDYATTNKLLTEPSILANLDSLWSFGMSATLTLTWLLFLPLNYAVASDHLAVANVLGVAVLVVLGPNLLGWAIFGTVIGMKLIDWSQYGEVGGPIAKAANLMTWCFLYMIAIIFTYGAIQSILDWLLTRREERELSRMRELVAAALPRETLNSASSSQCVICLDSYKPGDVATRLHTCSHRFHTNCIEGWLQYRTQCPTCRGSIVP